MNETIPVNSNISRYRILSKLGAGVMGEVYLAEDNSQGLRSSPAEDIGLQIELYAK